MAVKIYFDIKDEQNVLYRSIRIQCSTTFADLHSKISEKIGISKSRSVFFRIALRYDSPVSQLRRDLYPPVCELVAPTVAREETAWVGEVFLVFIDTRPPSRRLVETASANEEVQRLAAGSSSKLAASPMTEFFFHSEGTDKFSAITESILTEVENVCVKRGKLLKVSQWKESVHRYCAAAICVIVAL